LEFQLPTFTLVAMRLVADISWFILSLLVYVALFFVGRSVVLSNWYATRVAPRPDSTDSRTTLAQRRLRATSWLLGLAASIMMLSASTYFTYKVLIEHILLRRTSLLQIMQWMDSDELPVGRGLTCGFIAYLVADIALGLAFYPSEIHILSGWVHHAAYAGILIWLLSRSWTNSFMA
jgi:hypothetical protein